MNARLLFPGVTLLVLVCCSGSATVIEPGNDHDGGPSSGGSSSGSGVDAPEDGPCHSSADGPRGAPAQHRTSTTCQPSTGLGGCLLDYDASAAGKACTSDADCAGDAGAAALDPYTNCLRGQCAVDYCLDDTDCPVGQVCSCSSEFYGGNACIHRNTCVPANCQVDGDCGPGGYCVPSTGYCGAPTGFYCNKPTDPCMDPSTDCSCGGSSGAITPSACTYDSTVGQFVCAPATVCAG